MEKPNLVERRLKYIQRQIDLDRSAVNVKFRGTPLEGQGPPNRYGMPKLPVGQHEVKNWPVLDLGEQPQVSPEEWKLEVGGLVEHPFTLTQGILGSARVLKLPRAVVERSLRHR